MDIDKNKGEDDGKQMDHLIYFSIIVDTSGTEICKSSISLWSILQLCLLPKQINTLAH